LYLVRTPREKIGLAEAILAFRDGMALAFGPMFINFSRINGWSALHVGQVAIGLY
jgi:hypothetical protein